MTMSQNSVSEWYLSARYLMCVALHYCFLWRIVCKSKFLKDNASLYLMSRYLNFEIMLLTVFKNNFPLDKSDSGSRRRGLLLKDISPVGSLQVL